jgi:transcription-repair coupling factor (superfamily II helicase)
MKDRIIELVAAVRETKQAAALCRQHKGVALSGLDGTVKSVFLAALRSLLRPEGTLVLIVSGRDAIREYRQSFSYLYPDLPVQELYPENLPRVQAETRNLEIEAGRAAALRLIHNEETGIVFVTAEAWMQRLPKPEGMVKGSVDLRRGEDCDQGVLLEKLIEIGYERTEEVDAIGQFSVRGEIMDIFPLNSEQPVRIEWYDETIDDLRPYDLTTQRSTGTVESLRILPLRKVGEDGTYDSTLWEYGTKHTLFVLDEPAQLFDTVQHLYQEADGFLDDVWTAEELEQQAEAARVLTVSALEENRFPSFTRIAVPVRKAASYNRSLNLLVEDLGNLLADGVRPYIMMSTVLKARSVAESLREQGVGAVCLNDEAEAPDKVNCGAGELFSGFRFWDESWLLLTENDIYGLQRRHRFKSKHKGAQLQYFTDIKGGDYVVHDVHGIGRYIGVETVEVDGIHRDYLLLQYAGTDRLYVPVDQVGLLHKYVGAEGVTPKLSKMGGAEWRRMKTKASTAITALAEELLRLYAKRKITPGYAFSPDTEYQREFEEKFPYEETPDQLKAIAEIKADMEKPVPMDRLLCGDVGYGKTEVALRAAFKAVMDGKQVAFLVPTTVLAQQHLLTFHERLDPFGLRVAMVSRFVSDKETKETLRKLEAGDVDILIGTHRLLQGDVVFHDLGLLIIDEEQRFGVAQKEKIKQWKQGIDVLALSATPIPRTLHMALVNTRDMSLIESPPEDRLPVETYVAEYSDGMIKEALERELRRGGRVYYVHNRISGLAPIAARLRRLVPGIKIRVGHGRMSEDALEDAMMDFYAGRCDVLLSTTIIENGLDVPMANTIIVEGAENFGLSQLYQMRGRVGRSSRLAYAYFVYQKNKVLSEVASKRLQAIRDFTELGAGFQIAMRDLEIRGAGNLLGPQQHGYIAGIGFAAYCEMLDQTVRRLKDGEAAGETRPDPILEIPRNAYIPDSYISNPRYKLELYRRFADLAWGEADNLMDEIIDRFGTPPEEVEELWHLAQVRALCRRLDIRRISVHGGVVRITFFPDSRVNNNYLVELVQSHPRMYLNWKQRKEPYFEYRTSGLEIDVLSWLEKELPRWIM